MAKELMTRSPQAVRATATVRRALELLMELDVRHLPVVNEQHELVGMVSDRDLRGLPLANALEGAERVQLDQPVSAIMSGDVVSVDTEATIEDVVDFMLELKVGALPVVTVDGVLVGIISYIDVLRALQKELATEHEKERHT